MISKENFINTINKIIDLEERMDKVDEAMNCLSEDFCGFFVPEFITLPLDTLTHAFNDEKNGWLCYFAYECNWLRDIYDDSITVNGKNVIVKTWEDVYDFLIEQMD